MSSTNASGSIEAGEVAPAGEIEPEYRSRVPVPEERLLSALGPAVSTLSLGSWRTFERISRDDGLEVMRVARELGINFLDDARYNDETGNAPMPTGYSEVVFGELFRAAKWPRDETIVANKLWWEFWPQQSATEEIGASLERMRFEYVDLIYALPPPADLGVDGAVEQLAALLDAGAARAWGIANWSAAQAAQAAAAATRLGIAQPIAAQLPYSIIQREPVEDPAMVATLHETDTGVVASFVLAGGVLSGKYETGATVGRAATELDQPRVVVARRAAVELQAIAADAGVAAAALAVAFVLANPDVKSALVGATSPGQLREAAGGRVLADSLDETDLARLRAIGIKGNPAST
jgi:aryl-alcohol dehydrogenase-like predicted oxidoreductase